MSNIESPKTSLKCNGHHVIMLTLDIPREKKNNINNQSSWIRTNKNMLERKFCTDKKVSVPDRNPCGGTLHVLQHTARFATRYTLCDTLHSTHDYMPEGGNKWGDSGSASQSGGRGQLMLEEMLVCKQTHATQAPPHTDSTIQLTVTRWAQHFLVVACMRYSAGSGL